MSNSIDIYSTHFSRGSEKFCRGASPPWLRACTHIFFEGTWHILFLEAKERNVSVAVALLSVPLLVYEDDYIKLPIIREESVQEGQCSEKNEYHFCAPT